MLVLQKVFNLISQLFRHGYTYNYKSKDLCPVLET